MTITDDGLGNITFSSSGGGGSNLNDTTGILFGGVLSATIGGATFSVTAGIGQIVTQTASIAGVVTTVTNVTWSAVVGAAITNIATSQFTYVLVNSSGTVIQQTTPFTDAQYKTHIIIGILCHIDFTSVNLVTNSQNVAYEDPHRLVELISAFGPIKKSGLNIGPNGANLRVNRTSGEAFKIGANYTTDQFEPDVAIISAKTPAKLCRAYGNNSVGFTFDTFGGLFYDDIDRNQYFNPTTGVLETVGGSKWTIQRLFFFPNNPDDIICYYGVQTYNQFSEARANLEFETFDEATITAENAVFLGFLFVRHNATALNDPTQAAFLQSGLFRGIPPGGGGSGGGSGTVTSVAATVPTPVNPAFSVSVPNPTTTPSVNITANGSIGQYIRGDGSLATFPSVAAPATIYYGDGFDGTIVLDGTNTYTSIMTLVGSTYRLNRSIFPSSLTVNAGITLLTNGYQITCNGTTTIDGTVGSVANNGGNAVPVVGNYSTAGVGATSLKNNSTVNDQILVPSSLAGGNGSNGSAGGWGAAGVSITVSWYYYGSLGGGGGRGWVNTTTQGPASTVALNATGKFLPYPTFSMGLSNHIGWLTVNAVNFGGVFISTPGAGGGAGANLGGAWGGAGGGGGGAPFGVKILSNLLVIGATGVIISNGGNGGNGCAGNGTNWAHGAGGGAGGGGIVYIVTNSLTYTPANNIQAKGGIGGTGGFGAGTGVALYSTNGSNGADGYIIIVNTTSGISTFYTGHY